ncbi:MAG: hypothetical protein IPL52_18050 [Flavobacteriales bacterium]|nr:hypothetical protein [Flavobacteriales bacterium]
MAQRRASSASSASATPACSSRQRAVVRHHARRNALDPRRVLNPCRNPGASPPTCASSTRSLIGSLVQRYRCPRPAKELELPYNQNHLTFTFTGIAGLPREGALPVCMLEGHDPDWTPITATDRVTYTNIPPGDYTFKVMARNASGVWNEQPVSYAFSIAPPSGAPTPSGSAVERTPVAGLLRYRGPAHGGCAWSVSAWSASCGTPASWRPREGTQRRPVAQHPAPGRWPMN